MSEYGNCKTYVGKDDCGKPIFTIETETEGNISYDGGYSFETVTSFVFLNKKEAERIIEELKAFIEQEIKNEE